MATEDPAGPDEYGDAPGPGTSHLRDAAVITSIESLLLRELQEAYQMFRHSEDLGDRRVNYLITLVSAILGALAIRKEGLGSAGHAVDPIFYYFTTVLIILALVTLRRVLERNVRSSEQLLAVAHGRSTLRRWRPL